MYVYRLKRPLTAVTHGGENRMRIVTLDAGTVVRTRKSVPTLPQSGLIDITVEGQVFSAFRQDLEERGERIEAAESGRAT